MCKSSQDALREIHSYHVIHGDIRLDNIMYDAKQNKAWFIDFGLSSIDNRESRKEAEMRDLLSIMQEMGC